jgi:hypothetical protein
MKTNKTNKEMGLEVKSFPKHKQWAVDQDYTTKLSKEEKDWLGQFNQEYYRNRIAKDNAFHNDTPLKGQFKTDIYGKLVLDKNGNKIPVTLKESCYSRENSANRDLYAIKDTGGAIIGDNSISDEDGNEISVLDTVADLNSIMDFDELDERLIQAKKSK